MDSRYLRAIDSIEACKHNIFQGIAEFAVAPIDVGNKAIAITEASHQTGPIFSALSIPYTPNSRLSCA